MEIIVKNLESLSKEKRIELLLDSIKNSQMIKLTWEELCSVLHLFRSKDIVNVICYMDRADLIIGEISEQYYPLMFKHVTDGDDIPRMVNYLVAGYTFKKDISIFNILPILKYHPIDDCYEYRNLLHDLRVFLGDNTEQLESMTDNELDRLDKELKEIIPIYSYRESIIRAIKQYKIDKNRMRMITSLKI